MATIELTVDDGSIVTTRRFTGRQLLRWRRSEGLRTRTAGAYRTATCQYAVHTRGDPDWEHLTATDGDAPGDASVRGGPAGGDWWERRPRELHVFATVEDMAGALPDDLVARVRAAKDQLAVEDLDI